MRFAVRSGTRFGWGLPVRGLPTGGPIHKTGIGCEHHLNGSAGVLGKRASQDRIRVQHTAPREIASDEKDGSPQSSPNS